MFNNFHYNVRVEIRKYVCKESAYLQVCLSRYDREKKDISAVRPLIIRCNVGIEMAKISPSANVYIALHNVLIL